MRYSSCNDLSSLLSALCVCGSNEVVIVKFYSFKIEEVAVNASTFFFIPTSQCSGLLGLLFGWIIDTSILICNTQHILQTLYVPKC